MEQIGVGHSILCTKSALSHASPGEYMSGSTRISILLIDPHPISLTGLRTILEGDPDLHVVGVAGNVDAAAARYQEMPPDILIVNTHTDPADGVRSVATLSRHQPPPHPAPNVLVLTSNAAETASQALEAGVKGVLPCSSTSEELIAAVRIIATGRSMLIPMARQRPSDSPLGLLTEREIKVFELMTRGFSNAEISAELTLSQSTVKSHIQRIMEKLGLRNRVHVVIFAYEKNLVCTSS
ncbi:response regulator transcription factor [Micromonospora sp. MS34]|uniref:response regulator transcription factor n=1 Tax=Micromonospora sp. MS34 TaxID=3385971 RepID=UPI0039A30CC7